MSVSDATTQDAVELLTADHAEVETLFVQVEEGPGAADDVVEAIVRELSVHAAIEEQILYPAMRKALPDGETLVQEAIDEHQQVKETLAAIESAGSPAERTPLLRSLIDDVRHHVDEEETELFPKLRASIGSVELREMGGKLAAAKKMAPTHPHPKAPNTPPGNLVGGVAAGLVDKVRDAVGRD